MRCPDCNKFVSIEELDGELWDASVNGQLVEVEVRIANACAECGGELTDAEFNMSLEIAVPDDQPQRCTDKQDHEWELDDSAIDLARVSRVEGTGRGSRTFYGIEASATLRCTRCSVTGSVSGEEYVQASCMEALV